MMSDVSNNKAEKKTIATPSTTAIVARHRSSTLDSQIWPRPTFKLADKIFTTIFYYATVFHHLLPNSRTDRDEKKI